MDLLQRIQQWYTINCNGDWEHSYGLSISTLDNPGWSVIIDLSETCLEKATLPERSLQERSPNDWVSWEVKNQKFIAYGGPNNLSDILSCFLDNLLPQQGDKNFEYEVYIPLRDYKGLIWRQACASLLNEGHLQILHFPNPASTSSYIINGENAFEAYEQLSSTGFESAAAIAKEGDIIMATIEEHEFSTDLVYAGHVVDKPL